MTATNRGATSLRTRCRAEDPMQAFDALPAPIRSWLSKAALPWSPASCRKILQRSRERGEDLPDVLARLDQAQARTLARDRFAVPAVTPFSQPSNQQDSTR